MSKFFMRAALAAVIATFFGVVFGGSKPAFAAKVDVKVCSIFGAGYYYVPGTDTCLKIGGYVRHDAFPFPTGSGTVCNNKYFLEGFLACPPVPPPLARPVKICSLQGAGFYYVPGTDTCLKLGGWIREETAFNGRQEATSVFTPNFEVGASLGFYRFSGSGSMTGIDTGVGGTTDSRPLDFVETSFLWGFYFRNYLPLALLGFNVPSFSEFAASDYADDLLYWEFGYDDPGKSTQSFANINAIPKGTGTATLTQRASFPLRVGLSISAAKFGIRQRGLAFEFFTGVNVEQWKSQFSLTEAAALPLAASRTWWTVSPAVGIGAKYDLGNGFRVGVNTTWAWVDSKDLHAQSPNFPTESYTLRSGSLTTTTTKFTIAKAFSMK